MSDKRYKLTKIADLFEIPTERFDDFMVDLKMWHSAGRATKQLIDTIAEVVGEEAPKDPITMVWIDDGKHEGKIIIKKKTTPTVKQANNDKED